MTDTAPKVIIIPAKKETPQEQEKKRTESAGSSLLPGVHRQ